MRKKLGQEPAFPISAEKYEPNFGVSKRFYAACFAMQGIISNPNTAYQLLQRLGADGDKKEADKLVIEQSYILADELLKQENED